MLEYITGLTLNLRFWLSENHSDSISAFSFSESHEAILEEKCLQIQRQQEEGTWLPKVRENWETVPKLMGPILAGCVTRIP